MGLLAKKRTVKRVAPVRGPFAAANSFVKEEPWLTHEHLVASAAIRGALLNIGVGDAKSTTSRSGGIGAVMFPSTLWLSWNDANTASIIMGCLNDKLSIAADWVLEVSVGADVIANTTKYKVLGDELVNGGTYDLVKEEVLAALASGGGDAEAVEIAASERAIKVAVDAGPRPEPIGQESFTFTTRSSPEEIQRALHSISLPRADDQPNSMAWTLGLASKSTADRITVATTPQSDNYSGLVVCTDDSGLLHARVARAGLRNWFVQAKYQLSKLDPDTTWHTDAIRLEV